MIGFNEQVNWFSNHKIAVNDKELAIDFLKNNNYFYKLNSFVDYFPNEISSFEMLVDISKLDMELRYMLLPLCLDIEHFTKTFIMRITTNSKNEDGYKIVDDTLRSQIEYQLSKNTNNQYEQIETDLKQKIFQHVTYKDNNGNIVVNKEYRQYYDNPPIWGVIDLSNFGMLRPFLMQLLKRSPNNNDLKILANSFKYINLVRNQCAHNSHIINKDIYYSDDKIPYTILTSLGSDGISTSLIKHPLIRNIAVLLRAHKFLCSKKSHEYGINNLKEWVTRTQRHDNYYQNTEFKKFFDDILTCVDTYQ